MQTHAEFAHCELAGINGTGSLAITSFLFPTPVVDFLLLILSAGRHPFHFNDDGAGAIGEVFAGLEIGPTVIGHEGLEGGQQLLALCDHFRLAVGDHALPTAMALQALRQMLRLAIVFVDDIADVGVLVDDVQLPARGTAMKVELAIVIGMVDGQRIRLVVVGHAQDALKGALDHLFTFGVVLDGVNRFAHMNLLFAMLDE